MSTVHSWFTFIHHLTLFFFSECGYYAPQPVPPINNDDLELRQVSIVFRHGDRIMWQDAECWPNDTAVFTCEDRHLSTPSFYEGQNVTDSGRVFRKS